MISRRTLAAAALALPGIVVASACSAGPGGPGGPASSGAGTRTVTTAQGTITIPAAPKRVAVLNFALVGLVFKLGVPVAVATYEASDADGRPSEFWADEAAAAGTTMIRWSIDGFNLEELAALAPDLIIAGGLGLPSGVATKGYDGLSRIAPTVIVDRALPSWREQLGFLAEVFDAKPAAAEVMSAYEARITEVRHTITPPPGPVMALTFSAPDKVFGFMPASPLWQLFDQLGLEPSAIATDQKLEPYTPGGDMFPMSLERVGDLASQPTLFVCGFMSDAMDVARLTKNSIFARLPAITGHHAYDLPHWSFRADHDQTLALIDLVEKLFG